MFQHVNREKENITENIKVLEYLEKAKAARRPIIRYIQVCVPGGYWKGEEAP